jgi:hypothetical protein
VAAPPGKGATSIDIGLYKSNSHEVCAARGPGGRAGPAWVLQLRGQPSGGEQVLAIPKCRVHHPSINRAAELVRQAARDLSVRPYDGSCPAAPAGPRYLTGAALLARPLRRVVRAAWARLTQAADVPRRRTDRPGRAALPPARGSHQPPLPPPLAAAPRG